MILEILFALCEEFNIPSWTAQTLKNAYDELAGISDRDSVKYSVANEAYQEMLDQHDDLSLLAMAYQTHGVA